ncbi:FAD-dependent monooxygenase [Actinomadura viridis]|uniref:FAD-dependent monooxygenase n=1 Tax=Actinomadura viridis TaxID=58110 RepID=UPI0036AC7A6F
MTDDERTVLISGAGIAGATLAYWLAEYGFRPTVVEREPRLRTGGNPIDVRGGAVTVAERMGVLPRIREARVRTEGLWFVDAAGERVAGMDLRGSADAPDGDEVELARGDLVEILHQASEPRTEYLFGDAIRSVREDPGGVTVTLERGGERRFGLVVGADGLHSAVRRLAFEEEGRFVHHLGYYAAAAPLTDDHGVADHWGAVYNEPGRMVGVSRTVPDRPAQALFAFRQVRPLVYDHRDVAEQKRLLAEALAGMSWRTPLILEQVLQAEDFYFDAVSQVRMPGWARGRFALVGDAGYCPALLSGAGTTLAMTGAYALAGALRESSGDHRAAFARYEAEHRAVVEDGQSKAAEYAGQLVPGSREAIDRRDALVGLPS